MNDRAEDIEYWWGCGFPGAFNFVDEFEPRLRRAFERVLQAMPAEDFEAFMEESPTLIYLEGARACVFRYLVACREGQRLAHQTVIYFDPRCSKWTDSSLLRTVAYECAHVVRKDHQAGGVPEGTNADYEAAADALSKKWGFRPCYSPQRLAKMKAR